MENTPQDNDDINSLEAQDTSADASKAEPGAPAGDNSAGNSKKHKMRDRLQGLATHINIYLLIFILVLILAGAGVFVAQQQTKEELVAPELTTQELTQEALEEINDNAVKIGDPKQTLNVESNAVFAGAVLVRGSLDVAGAIKVGGALNLPGLTVSGTSSFDQIQANGMSVAGDASIQGTLNIQKNITVAGGATFGGPISAPQITAQSLQLSGDLNVTRHLDAGGGTPGRSVGTAVGGGGTASISGTDTAGTVSINTGNSPSVGCFVTVNFAIRFNETPHVIITPIGSAAAAINYYVTRSSSNFSICTTNPAPAHQNFAFDFIAID